MQEKICDQIFSFLFLSWTCKHLAFDLAVFSSIIWGTYKLLFILLYNICNNFLKSKLCNHVKLIQWQVNSNHTELVVVKR